MYNLKEKIIHYFELKKQQQNAYFNPDRHYGLSDADRTNLTRQDIIKHYKSWLPKKQNGDIKISVITLLFSNCNIEFLTQNIISSLFQITSFQYELEIIFVIDPPFYDIDRKLELIKEYIGQYFNFKIIKNSEYIGYTASYLKAIQACEGEYIINLDYDDVSHPERFQQSIDYFANHPECQAVSFIPNIFYHEKGNQFYDGKNLENYRNPFFDSGAIVYFMANMSDITIACNPQVVCYKKTAARQIALEDKMIRSILKSGDQLIILAFLNKFPFGFYNAGAAMLFYRRHFNSACLTSNAGYYIEKSIQYNNLEDRKKFTLAKNALIKENEITLQKNKLAAKMKKQIFNYFETQDYK